MKHYKHSSCLRNVSELSILLAIKTLIVPFYICWNFKKTIESLKLSRSTRLFSTLLWDSAIFHLALASSWHSDLITSQYGTKDGPATQSAWLHHLTHASAALRSCWSFIKQHSYLNQQSYLFWLIFLITIYKITVLDYFSSFASDIRFCYS